LALDVGDFVSFTPLTLYPRRKSHPVSVG